MLADFAGAGNTAAVRLMLDLGFDAGMARIQPDWVAGETALHVAAAHGRQTVAELLIARAHRSRPKRHNGWTRSVSRSAASDVATTLRGWRRKPESTRNRRHW